MIPVGYMAKRVMARPEWLKSDRVRDIYSVSDCMSKNFADYINFWKHNGYWFFDSPEIMEALARENSIDLAGTTLFFYEAYEQEYYENAGWSTHQPDTAFTTDVIEPNMKALEGYDIATFSCGTTPECSPLSCNHLASEIETNEHCLLTSFEEAKALLEAGKFQNTEPGPFRIFAVYSVDLR